jgi:predicted  nucleic acid-binding Zn-ribbon protein
MKRSINGIEQRTTDLEQISGIYITESSLQTSLADIQNTVNNMNTALTKLEYKLQKITLPDATRYYLEESEITDFRNHFRQLRSMMSELEKSRQAFIRLASRYNLTNSSL